ncbi:PAS domain-containing sensor histidine kinase [Paenibacillus radicis (ex Xue et al. 2023)]|uniref:histidine kinase n=1 Tax=Paenibacillus radicis (ex Xue et al. 2023) TaxID=2972489 RepID=A0ABT1YH09_9BACL|nr:PAS domain-containing sensor histidine kinase [Paenibacillus radicis (ex Xue et al. 2023)]MCR8632471.1 ATP-binding protein [Paenibacillus radicis (ex Xue et al. 2023)]
MASMFSNFPMNSVSQSIKKKYLIIYSIVIIVPVLLIYNLILGYTHRIVEKDIVSKNLLSADALVKRFNTEISDAVLQMQLIAEVDEEAKLQPQRMYERAKQTIASSTMIQSVTMVDAQKQMLFEAPFALQTQRAAYDFPNFEIVRWSKNYAVSDVFLNPHGQRVVCISLPILDNHEQFIGMLIAELSQEHLSEVLSVSSVPSNGFSFIVDRSGRVIASTVMSEIGENFSTFPAAANISRYTSGSMKGEYHNESSIMAYKTMWDGWGLVLGVPERYAFKPMTDLSQALTGTFVCILLLTLLFIRIGVQKILQPIVRLTQFARSIERNDAIAVLPQLTSRSKDELTVLWHSMAAMAVSLSEKQRMVEEKERYLRDVIEGIPYAILTVDNEGRITHINQQFEKITGYPRASMMGMHLSDMQIENKEADFGILNSLNDEHMAEDAETYIIDAKGHKHVVKIVTSKFYNMQGGNIGSIAVFQDITQWKLLEEHAKQSEKLALIGQISTGIAHEIKNPLAILSGASELLKDEIAAMPQDETVNELVNDIYRVVRRMNGIVNQFLSFSKMTSEQEETIRVEKLLDETLHLLRIKLRGANIETVKDYAAEQASFVGKSNKLMQVFLNLILNSIEAMPDGGTLSIRTSVSGGAGNGVLVVEVKDTGMGISEQTMEWMFNPYFTTKEKGSGLGLTIARDIMMEHGGSLQIQSKADEGTTMRCEFPLQKEGESP